MRDAGACSLRAYPPSRPGVARGRLARSATSGRAGIVHVRQFGGVPLMAHFVADRVALRSAGPGPLSGRIPLTVAGILVPAATALVPRLAAMSATIGALERADVQVVVIRQAVA